MWEPSLLRQTHQHRCRDSRDEIARAIRFCRMIDRPRTAEDDVRTKVFLPDSRTAAKIWNNAAAEVVMEAEEERPRACPHARAGHNCTEQGCTVLWDPVRRIGERGSMPSLELTGEKP